MHTIWRGERDDDALTNPWEQTETYWDRLLAMRMGRLFTRAERKRLSAAAPCDTRQAQHEAAVLGVLRRERRRMA